MAEPAEQQVKNDFLIQKISTVVYSMLGICESVIDGFQKRLEEYEQRIRCLEKKDVDSTPEEICQCPCPSSSEHNDFCSSANILGVLLEQDSYGNKTDFCALEAVLRQRGTDVQKTTAEIKRYEEYFDRTNGLAIKYSDLTERARNVRYDILVKKKDSGKTLTSEEQELLSKIENILADNH